MNVRLPVGSFYIGSQLNLTRAQVLSGAGRASTILIIYNNFDPAAEAVIKMTPGLYFDYGAEVRDLGIYFTQPDDQAGGRAAFQPLGSCTTGPGGTGCKYPPAILATGARVKIKDVRIVRAWKGIVSQSAGWFDTLEISAIDTGLEVAVPGTDILDWSHYHGLHFWPFEVYVGTNLNNVYADGQMIAAKFGSANGVNVHDLTTLHGRVIVDGAGFWGYIDGLSLDAVHARLEVVRVAQPGLRITNMYTSGDVGGNGCKTSFAAQFVQVTNAFFQGGPGTQTFVCVTGRLLLNNSYFLTGAADQKAVSARGGYTELRGNTFLAGTTMAAPLVEATTGALVAMDNQFQVEPGPSGSIYIASDSPAHYIANNSNTKNWPVTFGFSLGGTILGYYDLGDQTFPTTVTTSFAVPGDSLLTPFAQGSGFALRGSYVEGGVDVTFTSNNYSTASGEFLLKLSPMPAPAPGNAVGCIVHLLVLVSVSSVPTCNVESSGFVFYKVVSGAQAAALSTAELPPNTNGLGFRVGFRYRIR